MAATPLATGTDVSQTIGGKEYSRAILHDTNGADAIGDVATSPASNTLLGRLKALLDAVLGTASADNIFAITPSDSTALSTIPKALYVTAAGNLAVRGTGTNPVTIPVTAGQVVPIRARYVYATNTTATVVGLA